MNNYGVFKKIFAVTVLAIFMMSCVCALAYAAEVPTILIDGKEAVVGQQIDYEITYKNVIGSKVDVTIVDTIPEHTSYVDGSADNGGVFENGKISWDIKGVEPWATVTVKFKVEVDAVLQAAVCCDDACEAQNSFSTSTVIVDDAPLAVKELDVSPEFEVWYEEPKVLHTVKEQSEPVTVQKTDESVQPAAEPAPAASTEQPEVKIKVPNTADNSELILWVCLLLVSGGAAVATMVFKKKEQ